MPSFKLELQHLLRLGTPILIAQFCQTGLGVVDTVMAGHYSSNDLAAVAMGYSVWLPIMLAMMGLIMGTTPMVAQAMGAKKTDEAASWLLQSLWLALILGGLTFWGLTNVHHLFETFGVPDQISAVSTQYLAAMACAMPAMAFYQSWRSFNEGIENTRIIMYVGLASVVLNIPLNYVFIYGKFGFPELGGVGCGVASALVFWSSAIVLWAYSRFHRHPASRQAYRHGQLPDATKLKALFLLGLPIAISLFAEVALFTGITLLLAFAGEVVIAGNQIGLNVSGLVFMVPLSLSLAMTIRIGHLVGAKEFAMAQFSRKVGQALSLFCAAFNASVLVFMGPVIVSVYTPDSAVATLAASLFIMAAIYQLPDALQITASGALRGYKDTAVPMVILVVSYWLCALPFGWWLSKQLWQGEALLAHGYWWGLVLGLSIAALLLNWRLRRIETLSSVR